MINRNKLLDDKLYLKILDKEIKNIENNRNKEGKQEQNNKNNNKNDDKQEQNVEGKAHEVMNSKNPNIIAKAIASFRNLYYKFMMKIKTASDSKENSWYKRLAAKILGWIDRLASRLQYLVDRRKGSEMKQEELDRYKSDAKRFNRNYNRIK